MFLLVALPLLLFKFRVRRLFKSHVLRMKLRCVTCPADMNDQVVWWEEVCCYFTDTAFRKCEKCVCLIWLCLCDRCVSADSGEWRLSVSCCHSSLHEAWRSAQLPALLQTGRHSCGEFTRTETLEEEERSGRDKKWKKKKRIQHCLTKSVAVPFKIKNSCHYLLALMSP